MVAWRRIVNGVREMCDVCATTLFNYHWSCNKCGFAVCIDCNKNRKDCDRWSLCTDGQAHEHDELMMVQIIPANSLDVLEHRMQSMCAILGISQYSKSNHSNHNNKALKLKMEYTGVPHSWLCDGKLLRLMDPMHMSNLKVFQDQWSRGKPVLVSGVTDSLDMNIWQPESFSKDFGEDINEFVNCVTGMLLENQPMKRFWDGFDNINKRIKDENGQSMLLKLKDWPPDTDFAEKSPARFEALMKSLPLGDYTKRNGAFNLVRHMPECFLKPKLGPKMYIAYGSALYPRKGTTNLHLDISDTVNVMMHVSMPKDPENRDLYIEEVNKVIEEAGCDTLTKRRVLEDNELPGALWHIYAPSDTEKIRNFLRKVAIERGEMLNQNHDVIHDQNCYLDSTLRKRLYDEYHVEGYPIVQYLGDAIFIPAGAPHQVLNLHNCIKVATDFVSPENVSECLRLTHEIRMLSDKHSNHADKLQMKNILYHAVKNALLCVSSSYICNLQMKTAPISKGMMKTKTQSKENSLRVPSPHSNHNKQSSNNDMFAHRKIANVLPLKSSNSIYGNKDLSQFNNNKLRFESTTERIAVRLFSAQETILINKHKRIGTPVVNETKDRENMFTTPPAIDASATAVTTPTLDKQISGKATAKNFNWVQSKEETNKMVSPRAKEESIKVSSFLSCYFSFSLRFSYHDVVCTM